jgi:hypothetical protein
MINFTKLSKFEIDLIERIADRAVALGDKYGHTLRKIDIVMDIAAAHIACPLKLDEMLHVERDNDFGHDVFGIRENLNRQTGEIENCFLPRFAA